MVTTIKPCTSQLIYSLKSKSKSAEEDLAKKTSTSQLSDNMSSVEAEEEWDELFEDLGLSKTTDINNNEPSVSSQTETSAGSGHDGQASFDNTSSGDNLSE